MRNNNNVPTPSKDAKDIYRISPVCVKKADGTWDFTAKIFYKRGTTKSIVKVVGKDWVHLLSEIKRISKII